MDCVFLDETKKKKTYVALLDECSGAMMNALVRTFYPVSEVVKEYWKRVHVVVLTRAMIMQNLATLQFNYSYFDNFFRERAKKRMVREKVKARILKKKA